MKGKKSFVLYTDLIHTVNRLPNDKAGELFKHILEYVNDNDPQTDDVLLQIAFEPIKQSLKRDLQEWLKICERNRINGAKGGRPKNPDKPSGLSGNPDKPKKADNDSDSDNVSDKDYIYTEVEFSQLTPEQQIEFSRTKLSHLQTLEMWIERVAMNHNLTRQTVNKKLIEFGKDIQLRMEFNKSIKDLQSHFVNWLKKNK